MAVPIDQVKYCAGRILYLENFEFPGFEIRKNKYSIILHVGDEKAIILHCLPTSVSRGKQKHETTHGCNEIGFHSCYQWDANVCIGVNGFSFPRKTVVNFRMNLQYIDFPDLEIIDINDKMELLDVLSTEELNHFVTCAAQSRMTPRSIKKKLLGMLRSLRA